MSGQLDFSAGKAVPMNSAFRIHTKTKIGWRKEATNVTNMGIIA